MKTNIRRMAHRRGTTIVLVLACMIVVVGVASGVIRASLSARREARLGRQVAQAELLREAGAQRAIVKIKQNSSYTGEEWRPDLSAAGYTMAEVVIEVTSDKESDLKRVHVRAGIGNGAVGETLVHRSIDFTVKQ